MAGDLVSRLLAAIEEVERRANTQGHRNPDDGGYYSCPAVHTEPYGDLPWGEDACDCGLAERRADALRLCQAHRDIVAAYVEAQRRVDRWPVTEQTTLRQAYVMARGYAGGLRKSVELAARGYGIEDGDER